MSRLRLKAKGLQKTKPLQAVEKAGKVKLILLLMVFIFGLNYVHQLVPCNEVDGKCYPRGYYHLFENETERSLQSHVYYLAERVRLMIYVFIIVLLIDVFETRAAFILQAGYFFDYLFFNNDPLPWFNIDFISYTYFMGLFLLFITIRKFYLEWNRL